MKAALPNFLTWGRIVLVAPMLWLYAASTGPLGLDVARAELFVLLVGIVVVLVVSDYLDGYLARRWNVLSAFGAFLDPLADKVMVLSTFAVVIWQLPLGGWEAICWCLLMLLASRDGLVTLWRVQGRTGRPSAAAKWKTGLEMALVLTFLIGVPLIGSTILMPLDGVGPLFALPLACVTGLAWWTARDYARHDLTTAGTNQA